MMLHDVTLEENNIKGINLFPVFLFLFFKNIYCVHCFVTVCESYFINKFQFLLIRTQTHAHSKNLIPCVNTEIHARALAREL